MRSWAVVRVVCALVLVGCLGAVLLEGNSGTAPPVQTTSASSTTTSSTTTSTTQEPADAQPPDPPPVAAVAPPSAAEPAAPRGCSGDFDCFRACTIQRESRGDYSINTGNGYFGAWQFLQSTWDAVAGNSGHDEWVGRPASEAPPEVQDAVARFLWEHSGTRPWGNMC